MKKHKQLSYLTSYWTEEYPNHVHVEGGMLKEGFRKKVKFSNVSIFDGLTFWNYDSVGYLKNVISKSLKTNAL